MNCHEMPWNAMNLKLFVDEWWGPGDSCGGQGFCADNGACICDVRRGGFLSVWVGERKLHPATRDILWMSMTISYYLWISMNIYEMYPEISKTFQDQGHDSGWFWCFLSRGNKMLDFLFRKHWSSDWWPCAFWKHTKRTVRMCENMHSEGFQSLLENVLSPLSQSVTFVTALGLERDQNVSSHLSLNRIGSAWVFPWDSPDFARRQGARKPMCRQQVLSTRWDKLPGSAVVGWRSRLKSGCSDIVASSLFYIFLH